MVGLVSKDPERHLKALACGHFLERASAFSGHCEILCLIDTSTSPRNISWLTRYLTNTTTFYWKLISKRLEMMRICWFSPPLFQFTSPDPRPENPGMVVCWASKLLPTAHQQKPMFLNKPRPITSIVWGMVD